MNIQKLVKAALPLLCIHDTDKFINGYLSYTDFIKEFRTLNFSVPRQSGKTEYLLEHHQVNSSLLFFRNHAMISNYSCSNLRGGIYTITEIDNLPQRMAGRSERNGLKYQCFLIDEPGYMTGEDFDSFYTFVNFCKSRDLLTKDFYVLAIGTDTQ